ADVRAAILGCLRELPYAVGVTGLVAILRGSPNTPASAARLAQFGACADTSRTLLNRAVQALLDEGALERYMKDQYPMLRIADAGG
ncbi:MAG TPA: RQC domain-containing protein, partial [Ktedonobacterales bacterium]|nr:RQC domain-containing protein [Ktedonobacterales bacterium]